MAIAVFTGGPQGPKGDKGIPNDRDINSMIMLAWQGAEPIIKGYDLYTNNFSNSKGVDPQSVAMYNPVGYYETIVGDNDYTTTVTFTDPSDVYRLDKKDTIYKWVQDYNEYGHFEGMTYTLTSGGAVVDKGGAPNKVGFPLPNQPYSTGHFVEVRGSTNYNTTFTVDATSSVNEVVVASPYTSETLGDTARINQRITIGAGNNNPNVISGSVVEFPSETKVIMSITGSGYRFAETRLGEYQRTSVVTGMYDTYIKDNKLLPGSYYTTTYSGWSTVINNGPDARYEAAMAYDSYTKNLWLFGGYRLFLPVNTNELWAYSTVSGQWTKATPVSSPSARQRHSMIFDPINNHVIVWGGYIAAATNEMWKYSVVSGTWTQQTFAGGPTARYYHTAVYMPASGTMLVFGGNTGSRVNELWEYKISNNIWTQLSFAGGPTARDSHVAICQTVSGAMIVHGGNTGSEVSETWKLDYIKNGWKQLTSSPVTIRLHGAFYDDVNDDMICMTGYRSGSPAIYIYRYNLDITWTDITPTVVPNYTTYTFGYAYDSDNKNCYVFSGYSSLTRSSLWKYTITNNSYIDVLPDMRYGQGMIFVRSKNKIYITLGSNTSNHAYTDIWEFDCTNQTFTRIIPSTLPATYRRSMSIVYSPILNALLLFSGLGPSTNDLWKFDFATNNWVQLFPSGVIPAWRENYASAYVEQNDRWYIFGGWNNASITYSDLWFYDARSNIWVQLVSLGSVPSVRQGSCMTYDSVNACLWLFGGYSGAVYYSTLYKYDIINNIWSLVVYTGSAPSARNHSSMVYDYRTQSLFIFGGANAGGKLNDFYRYDINTNTMYTINTDASVPIGKTDMSWAYNDITGDMYVFGGAITAIPYMSSDLVKYNVWDVVAQSTLPSTTTSGIQVNTKHWSHINNITPANALRGTADIYHTLSFDNRTTFQTFSGGVWKPVIRNNGGTWQYLDISEAWQNSTTNDATSALQLAMTVSGNRLNSSSLAAITPSQYNLSGGFSSGTSTLDLGTTFNCPYNYIPELNSYQISYSASNSDLTLITEVWEASAVNPISVLCLLDIVTSQTITLDTDLKAWISMDNGSNYQQITGLSLMRSVDNHQYIKGDNASLTPQGNNQMKFKVTTHNSKQIEVHSIGVALRWQ